MRVSAVFKTDFCAIGVHKPRGVVFLWALRDSADSCQRDICDATNVFEFVLVLGVNGKGQLIVIPTGQKSTEFS